MAARVAPREWLRTAMRELKGAEQAYANHNTRGGVLGAKRAGGMALRGALTTNGPADAMNALLFDVSGAVSGLTTTRDALDTIASSAKIALQSQAGVDLDHEAVNLIRFQQAFQASGRAMQVASDLFDTILGIR